MKYMRGGGGLLPVWTNFTLGLLHRRPRIESSQRQKNFDSAGIFQKQHHCHWDAISQSLEIQSDPLPLCHAELFLVVVVWIINHIFFWEKVEVSLGFENLWPVADNKVFKKAALRLNKRFLLQRDLYFLHTKNQMHSCCLFEPKYCIRSKGRSQLSSFFFLYQWV